MSVEENRQRYTAALHGMQSGVAMKMNYDVAETTPKHLRVGVNSVPLALHRVGERLRILLVGGYREWLQEQIAPGLDNIHLG